MNTIIKPYLAMLPRKLVQDFGADAAGNPKLTYTPATHAVIAKAKAELPPRERQVFLDQLVSRAEMEIVMFM